MIRIHPIVICAIALGLFLPARSYAQDVYRPPITVITGLSAGRADLSDFNALVLDTQLKQLNVTPVSKGGDTRKAGVSGEFGLGWRFNRYFAAELALGGGTSLTDTQRGRVRDSTGDDWGYELRSSANAFAVHLSFLGTLPVGEDFEVFGRLGATRKNSEIKTSLRCVEDCTLVPQNDGHPAYCDRDGKNCVDAKPDSPPAPYSRRATLDGSRSLIPVVGAGVRWRAFRVEYRAMRIPLDASQRGANELFINQPRLQVSNQHALVQTVLFSYVWGAGSTWQ